MIARVRRGWVAAADRVETAAFHPEDDRYLVQHEDTVTHYEVRAEG